MQRLFAMIPRLSLAPAETAAAAGYRAHHQGQTAMPWLDGCSAKGA